MRIIAFFVFGSAISLLSSLVYAQSAFEIIQNSENIMRSGTLQATMQITTHRPKWSRTLELKFWAKGLNYTMILITSPAKEKGTVFLKRKKEAWNYIPSIERNIKLPPSMMAQSWMGTDFTNDDLVQESSLIKDYTHQLKTDSVFLGEPCWQIELKPKEDAAVVWGKLTVFVCKKNDVQLAVDLYDEEGVLVNQMRTLQMKELGGRMLATQVEMNPVDKPGHKTVMTYVSCVFDDLISDDFFRVNQMKRIQ